MTIVQKTALWNLHQKYGGKMVEFTGYDLPVQYKNGVKAEHLHVRAKAGLFDVSHMGQVMIKSKTGQDPAISLEELMPSDLQGLKLGKMRYTVLLNDDGGILDDLIVTRVGADQLFVVFNAARKEDDIAYIREKIGDAVELTLLDDKALIALQGPMAVDVLQKELYADAALLGAMSADYTVYKGHDILISRSGYTGEDGFEISVPEDLAEEITELLLADSKTVWPIGLGARDSLRLEAGFCLYGHDITEETTPIEAGLGWIIPKTRRDGNDVERKRVGLRPEGRAPIREGVELFDAKGAVKIGAVTSGGFSPVLEAPIAMGYVTAEHADLGDMVTAHLRGKYIPCKIVKMPFVTKDKSI